MAARAGALGPEAVGTLHRQGAWVGGVKEMKGPLGEHRQQKDCWCLRVLRGTRHGKCLPGDSRGWSRANAARRAGRAVCQREQNAQSMRREGRRGYWCTVSTEGGGGPEPAGPLPQEGSSPKRSGKLGRVLSRSGHNRLHALRLPAPSLPHLCSDPHPHPHPVALWKNGRFSPPRTYPPAKENNQV